MESKQKVIQLFAQFNNNCETLKKLENAPFLKEEHSEYRFFDEMDKGNIQQSLSPEWSKKSIHEQLQKEREKLFQRIEELRISVEFTKLMLYQLDDWDNRLITLRYITKRTLYDILRLMYMSRSSYYRHHDRIVTKLAHFYDDFFQGEGDR